MKVQPSGLVAAAQRLRSAAAQLAAVAPVVHPPLAADQTSVTAAGRFNEAATALQSVATTQAAALLATVNHLITIASRFAEQETLNGSTVRTLRTTRQSVGSPGLLAPVPPVPADVRPPLPTAVAVDGETVARQLCAGSASAGADFIHSWRDRSARASAAADVIRDVLPALHELWNSPAGVDATTTRLLQQAEAIKHLGHRAALLADQADNHARAYSGAVAQTPKPSDFEAVRTLLRQALEANARFPGRYTPLVSSLIAQQGALQHQALNTQTQYHEETETGLAAQLPGLLGGLVGGVIAAAAQVPHALMQSGQQLAQATVQGLSGLATSAASGVDSAPRDFDKSSVAASYDRSGTSHPGATTTAAGATDTAPVTPTTSSAPPPTPTLPQGAPPTGAVAAAGPSAVPMGAPMGMLTQPPNNDTGQQVSAGKKIVVPAMPHTESVTGKMTPYRLALAGGISVPSIEDEVS